MNETNATVANTRAAEATLSRRPRLGFAGVGWIGRNRLEAIARSGLAEIAAVTDTDAAATARVCETSPAATTAGSFDELLHMELDGIVIATPSALHAEQTAAALEAGFAVFCQKPLARTADETARVLDAARRADRLLGVDLSYRHTAGMQRIRELIRSGSLGKIFAAELVFHNAYGPDKPWFYDARLSGGGCLIDLGTHLIDLALWCLDAPPLEEAHATLLARGEAFEPGGDRVEDYAAAQLRLRGGISVQLACSWRVHAGCDAHIEATFFGTEGGATFRNVGGSFLDFVGEHCLPDRSRRPLAAPPDAWGARAAVEWTRRLADSPRFNPEIESALRVATALDRLYGR